jgi:AcrR family transcriptional regulator
MQVLKPEVQAAILSAAERLFFDAGYESVPMRRIAAKVGISVSNLYKYFASKQALFAAVVEPFHRATRSSLDALFAQEHGPRDERIAELVTQLLVRLIRTDRRRFVILMGRSRGTRYASFRSDLTRLIARHVQESVRREGLADGFMVEVIAGNFLEAMLRIAEGANQRAGAVEARVAVLVRYHMGGIAELQ